MFKFVEALKNPFNREAPVQPQQQASNFTFKAPAPTTREGWDPQTSPYRNSVDYKDYPMCG